MKHNDLVNHVCFWLNKWGALAFIHDSVGIYDSKAKRYRVNRSPFRLKGVADILGVCGGLPLAVEIKIAPDKQSDEQKEFEKRWVAAGGVYVLAYSLLDVKTELGLPDTIEMPKSKLETLRDEGQENRRS